MPAFGLAIGSKALRVQARKPLQVCNAFVLKPTGDAGAPITLKPGTFAVGADKAADITIDVETVSGSHAKLQIDDSSVTVTDLGSTNGTFVDGAKVDANKAVQIKAGGTVSFGEGGSASFTLVEEAEPAAPAEAAPVEVEAKA